MKVQFLQAVRLAGENYSRGVHDVSEKALRDPYFHRLIVAGLVKDAENSRYIAPMSLQERQKMLAERVCAHLPKPPKANIPVFTQAPPAPEAPVISEAPPLEMEIPVEASKPEAEPPVVSKKPRKQSSR